MNAAAAVQVTERAEDDALQVLLGMVSAKARQFSEDQQVDAETVEAMKAAGVYRALVPAQFGGDEKSPVEFLRLLETIAVQDGSAGWVASFGVSHMYLASLPAKTLEQVYADGPDVVFAGTIFPPIPAVRVEGGYRVTGRWPFGSGSTGASLIGVGIRDEAAARPPAPHGGDARRQGEDRAQLGCDRPEGTGSHDLVVEDVFVPDEWTFVRGAPRP
jgi:alkylation response protein AidB-like acyl-CoA dehydrogenase